MIDGNMVFVMGVDKLLGVNVMVIDLCVLVSFVIVGLCVDGEMFVDCIYYLDCGYDCMEVKLIVVGVNVCCFFGS